MVPSALACGLDSHRVLHSDWGDTRTPTRNDGGFETLAVVYSDIRRPLRCVRSKRVDDMLAMDTVSFSLCWA